MSPCATGGGDVTRLQDWSEDAACRTSDSEALFADGAGQTRAKAICTGCPVRAECLADALDNRIEWGVWGGLTERERRALLRRRPHVASWRGVLLDGMAAHSGSGSA
ncbi:WhiB family transcriptional regulator [Streptomyces sp. NPDC002952]|uniref:WhiB family transcriptional regulator n=1 Tax=Streptomyces sp. NPDC002952 TaxID=3364673 RepID=UPI0036B0B18A